VNDSHVASILLMGADPALRTHLDSRIRNLDVDVQSMSDAQNAMEWISHQRRLLHSVVIGPDIDEPVRLAQRIHRVDRDIALLILSDETNEPQVRRALQFTPFLGDDVTSHVQTETSEISDTLYDTVIRGRQRRQFRTTIAAMNTQLGTFQPHRISAVQYLDHVLDHAPIGVVALDPEGLVLSSNQRAGEILGQCERDLLGASLLDAFDNEQRARLQACLTRADAEESRGPSDIFTRRLETGDEQYVAVTAATLPVEPGEHGTLVILQDVTTQMINEREREAALQLRDDFLSMAAHELKTPLTSVKGFVDLLGRRIQQGDWDQTRIIRLQEQLSTQIDRLEQLVGDLLDVSRIQQGRLDPNFEPVDLALLARQVVQSFIDDPNGWQNRTLVLNAPESVVGVWDPDRLDQVITNLVSNALKYSPEGAKIDVQVSRRGNRAEFMIADEGVGIDKQLQESLFQPFMRGNFGGDVPGSGLGLHITARIVEQHGGTISVESEPGEGSTFTVRLPLDSLAVQEPVSEVRHTGIA
jgi:PAS domain S-box-containing protein